MMVDPDYAAYSQSIRFVEADRIGPLIGFSASYGHSHQTPTTTLFLEGGRADIQQAITNLRGSKSGPKLGRGRITAQDGTNISLAFEAMPRDVLKAAKEVGLLGPMAAATANRVVARLEAMAEARSVAEPVAASLPRWRSGTPGAPPGKQPGKQPSRARAPTPGGPEAA